MAIGWNSLTPDEIIRIYNGDDLFESVDQIICISCKRKVKEANTWNTYDAGDVKIQLCSVDCLVAYKSNSI